MIAHPTPAQVSLPSDTEVQVTRAFNAPRELVWEAYTTADLVRRWLLGPPGWTMPVCEMDVRVGGAFRWVWKADEGGAEFGFHGLFVEIQPPARLVHTQHFDAGDVGGSMGESGEARITLTLEERDGLTTVTSRIDYGSKPARDAAVSTGMTDGMEASYQKLDELLVEPS